MPKVLLVDDEPNIRWALAESLKRQNYDTLTASDFDSAIAVLNHTNIDAAVIDIHLPGKSGVELLKELHDRDPDLPIIMITGDLNLAQVPEIVRGGAYEFISKPIMKDVLVKAVGRAVEKKRLTEEKRWLEQRLKEHAAQLETRVNERTAELARAQALLAHNEKIAALGRMAAQVAHEVKNPLAGLRLCTLHLKSEVTDKLSAEQMSLIDKIIDGINHLSNTAEQILNFARPINLAPQRADVNRVLATVIELLESQIIANQIEVKLDLAPPGAVGLLDESSMQSALINLVLNAIQAMPNGGTLIVTTSSSGAKLHLLIADTGAGMNEEQRDNLFEPFYTTKSRGLGLGMPYAQKVIEQHMGVIKVESRQGEGTRILIELPAGE